MALSAQPPVDLPVTRLAALDWTSFGEKSHQVINQAQDVAGSDEVPVQIYVRLSGGGLRFNPQLNNISLTIETPEGTVNLQGKGDFVIAVDPTMSQTTVGSYQGTLTIQPAALGSQPVSLIAGQKVQVDASGVGTVSAMPTTSSNSGILVLVLGCICGLVLLVVIVIVLVIKLRKRSKTS